MRSNVMQRYLHSIYNVRVTLQSEYYNNIFASTAVKFRRGVLCVV